ncbi:MAG: Tetratricopeptide repeat-containing protein [Fibrobacteres bacterium]|nr:Tetratricopeptide repeat-containing protein [Fibrobacterota bacterium]
MGNMAEGGDTGKGQVKNGPKLPFLGAALLSICLFFPALEGLLKVCGYGYHGGYLLPLSRDGKRYGMVNPSHLRAFFPGRLVPYADPVLIPDRKDSGVYRIFILGESAAAGTPDPSFGFSRMLERMLEARHAGIRFEVFNLSVTAINSHVLLSMAKEAARHRPDLFIVYMGNNEVIGPFGPGTVFVPFLGRNAFIRPVAALRATRTGQLLEGFLAGMRGSAGGAPQKWAGMEMFLSRTVTRDDPRLPTAYANFRGNLEGIVAAARSSGAQVIVATVATNLRDNAPFASSHRAGISPTDSLAWSALFDSAAVLAQAGQAESALSAFRRAAAIDDRPAEIHFRLGRLLLGMDRPGEAAIEFQFAEDGDALRFRADSRINGAIRETARAHGPGRTGGVWLADADSVFRANAPDHAPGREFFYEHVHLRHEGNHLLAGLMVPFVDSALAATGRLPETRGSVPGPEAVRLSLALTGWNKLGMAEKILALAERPPFAGTSDHAERVALLKHEVDSLQVYASNDSLQTALAEYQEAIGSHPDDAYLHRNLGELFYACDYLPEAADAFRKALDILPQDSRTSQRLARTLIELKDAPAAILEYRKALAFSPRSGELHNGLANALAGMGEHAEAVRHYREALKGESPLPEVRFNLARTYIALGKASEAVAQLEAALMQEPGFEAAARELRRLKAAGAKGNGP